MTVFAVFQPSAARAAPADIFSIPAPSLGAEAPRSGDARGGEVSVTSQTGQAGYAYPIQTPPGRRGMAPKLALSYSSAGGLYGGIAAGFAWNLSIPEIREDTSESRLKTHSPMIEVTQPDPRADDRFLGAGGRRLVPVVEPIEAGVYKAYREQGDDQFLRYERMNGGAYRWRVRSPDGSTLYFGGSTAACANIGDGFAPLTEHVDAFGNAITYHYESVVDGECRIRMIEWGANSNASLAHFARVELQWEQIVAGVAPICQGVPVGSHTDFRSGFRRVTGASILEKIRATAFPPNMPAAPVHTREITLRYARERMDCNLNHAPLRLLTSIQESAWGEDAPRVDLPPVVLEYGDPAVVLVTPSTASPAPWSGSTLPNNLGWGFRYLDDRWPSVESMLVDLDGDGLVDHLENASTEAVDGTCRARWRRNRGLAPGQSHVQFDAPQTFTLPRLKWHGPGPTTSMPPSGGGAIADASNPRFEKCALNGQVTSFYNSIASPPGCHEGGLPGGACHAASDPDDGNQYCGPNGRVCPPDSGNAERSYLAYRWLDADGDGLVDLVAAAHGDVDRYDIEQGNLTLNGSPRPPEPDLFGPWPACPTAMDRCRDVNPHCVADANGDPHAVNQCVAQAPVIACGELAQVVFAPGGGTSPGQSGYRTPYTRCEGLYPWFIYKNQGNGVFAPPVIKYQPVPLESDTGDANLGGPGMLAQRHAIIDFDGDGVLDAVVQPNPTAGDHWLVWFGDGTGGFEPRSHLFFTRVAPHNRINATGAVTSGHVESSGGLFDLNADGLPDHWLAVPGQGNASVLFHTGTNHALSFAATTPFLAGSFAVKPGDDAATTITSMSGTQVLAGTTTAKNRRIDVDGDGRVDVVQTINGTPTVFFNVGGQLKAPGVPYPGTGTSGSGDVNGYKRLTRVSDQGANQGTWETTGDLVDLDGDGIAEAAYFGAQGFIRATHDLLPGAPRLLRAVHNGRGGHTTITYASMHDRTAVDPATSSWTDAWGRVRPGGTPTAQWVVKALRTTDDFAATTAVTSSFYRNPRHGADEEGHSAFRGFESVETTSPSGAKTVQRYSYAPDWNGRLIETVVQPAAPEASVAGEVRTIDKTTWERRALFGGTVVTHHPTVAQRYVCSNGQNQAQCEAAPAAVSQTTSTWTALSSTTQPGSPPILWSMTEELLQGGTTPDGDRKTSATFVLDSTPSSYQLRQLTETKHHRNSGAFELYAKSAKTWDPSYRVQLTDEIWIDSSDATRAITHFEYDLATGNVRKRWKPEQHATNKHTAFTYDTRALFVATEVNEVGHQRDFTHNYGTGTQLTIQGPNQRTCVTGPGCPLDALHPLKELKRTRIDGLGREIERASTSDLSIGEVYFLVQTHTTTYVDVVNGSTPTSETRRARINSGATVWTQERIDYDGQSRPIRKTVFAQGSAPSDHVTVNTYRDDGTLATVEVPDPSKNDASRVTYRYTYDSLGRPTSIRRPDAASASSQSGTDILRNGLVEITTEIVGEAGGHAKSTKRIHDVFGRLIEVHERTSTSGPFTWATTLYHYNPADQIRRIDAPEGVVTELLHDFANRRTRIERHGRAWRFVYDRNGNMIAEQAPGSTGAATDIDYTNTTVYDDLDRIRTRVLGRRTLSQTDRTLFAAGTEEFVWDAPITPEASQLGYLSSWRAYAPGATIPSITTDFLNDSMGRRISTSHKLKLAGLPELTRTFVQTFSLLGGPSLTGYADGADELTQTVSFVEYDPRGLPSQLRLLHQDQPETVVAAQTRNVAGLVTNRRFDTAPTTFVASSWSYDPLGRVASQVVQKTGAVQISRQDLTYFGNNNPSSLTHYIGTTGKQLGFTYDARHQLTTITSPAAGYLDATYQYGAGGRFSRVTQAQTITPAPAGSAVRSRDVTYVYGDADPERVTALANVDDGTLYANYGYDPAGNQTHRCLGAGAGAKCTGELLEYTYDGRGQLRRVAKKSAGVVQSSEEYWYDNGGQRIAIVKRDATGTSTDLIWFIGDVEAHYTGDGMPSRTYSHLTLGMPVARIERSSSSTDTELLFHGLANHLIASVAINGDVRFAAAYAPFGETLERAVPPLEPDAHRRRVNDRYVDEVSGNVYYGARYYDPLAIVWTQPDPLYSLSPDLNSAEPRFSSLYTYSLNNPLRYLDPDGTSPEDMAREVRIPTRQELLSTVERVRSTLSVSAGRGVDHERRTALTVVHIVRQLFNIDVNGVPIRVTDIGDATTAAYTDGDVITVRTSLVQSSDTLVDMVFLAVVLLHEAGHVEQFMKGDVITKTRNGVEAAAYQSGRILLARLRKRALTEAEYKALIARVNRGNKASIKRNCAACDSPLHQHEDLLRMGYRRYSTPFLRGTWGIVLNPAGPAAPPKMY